MKCRARVIDIYIRVYRFFWRSPVSSLKFVTITAGRSKPLHLRKLSHTTSRSASAASARTTQCSSTLSDKAALPTSWRPTTEMIAMSLRRRCCRRSRSISRAIAFSTRVGRGTRDDYNLVARDSVGGIVAISVKVRQPLDRLVTSVRLDESTFWPPIEGIPPARPESLYWVIKDEDLLRASYQLPDKNPIFR
jgi:hypothetical protein